MRRLLPRGSGAAKTSQGVLRVVFLRFWRCYSLSCWADGPPHLARRWATCLTKQALSGRSAQLDHRAQAGVTHFPRVQQRQGYHGQADMRICSSLSQEAENITLFSVRGAGASRHLAFDGPTKTGRWPIDVGGPSEQDRLYMSPNVKRDHPKHTTWQWVLLASRLQQCIHLRSGPVPSARVSSSTECEG